MPIIVLFKILLSESKMGLFYNYSKTDQYFSHYKISNLFFILYNYNLYKALKKMMKNRKYCPNLNNIVLETRFPKYIEYESKA